MSYRNVSVVVYDSNWPNANNELFANWAGEWVSDRTDLDYIGSCRLYGDIVNWLVQHVIDFYHNACWVNQGGVIRVQFRKESDLLMFILRFGDGR